VIRVNQLQECEKEELNSIDLCITLQPEMVRVVRLTVSGIASTIGLPIDDIEDIKVAVSEICNRIITKGHSINQRCIIRFIVSAEELKVVFKFEKYRPEGFKLFDDDDVFGPAIVHSIMDHVNLDNTNDEKDIICFSMHLKERLL